MTEIQLENESVPMREFRSRVILGELKRPKVLDVILKTGVVKNEAAAVHILLISAGIMLVVSVIIFGQTFKGAPEISPLDMDVIRSNANLK
ncbi:MAG: hypothetical protein V4686_03115 [Patescibacteria group bacterium]